MNAKTLVLKLRKDKVKRRISLSTAGLKSMNREKWLLYLPAIVANVIFGWYPLALGIIVGFQKYYLIKPADFVGLENFRRIFYDEMTPIVFRNTLYYTSLHIGLVFFVPIIVSILLMEMKKSLIRAMMLLWFIPTAQMAGLVIWKYFYNVNYGLFNGILTFLRLPTLGWLNDASLAMICIVLPGLIMFAPGLIYIASIQGIPDELYEASHLEGATLWQQIWYITLPRLRPIISVLLLLAIINSMQVFTQPMVMTGGGPGVTTTTVVMRFFSLAFTNLQFGLAGALAILLFILILSILIIQRKYFKENLDV